MVKYTHDAILKFNEIVRCKHCGKQMRRGQACVGFREIVCLDCANKWRADNG